MCLQARDDSASVERSQAVARVKRKASAEDENADKNPDTAPATKEVGCDKSENRAKEGASLEK